jgi:hypothetical protein
MNAQKILDRLESVKQTGPDRWLARCPCHNDRHPSLAIRELSDGRIVLHDFGGCSTESILAALGLNFGDLFPCPLTHHAKPERRPFPAVDILRALAFEAAVLAVFAWDIRKGKPFTEENLKRAELAAVRFNAALDAGGLR